MISQLDHINQSFFSHAKSSNHLNDMYVNRKRGMHGVGILYKHSIPLIATPLVKGNDRISVLQLDDGNAYKIYIIAVYLSQQQSNDNFMETIDVLDELVRECLRDGEVVIIGDTNCHFVTEVDVR